MDPVEGQLGRIAASKLQLDRLLLDYKAPSFAPAADDGVVLLRLSAIYFKSTPELMTLTTEFMGDKLTPEELLEFGKITAAFDESVKALEQGARTSDVKLQLASGEKATDCLAQYLKVATECSAHYTVPSVEMPYSSFRP